MEKRWFGISRPAQHHQKYHESVRLVFHWHRIDNF